MKLDARLAFDRFFAERAVTEIYSLFPCPWPKKAHIKNRLFTGGFFQQLNHCLRDDGGLRVVTDDRPYFNWIVEQLPGTGFALKTEEIRTSFDTKFEKKWRQAGQDKFFEMRLRKVEHQSVRPKEERLLKNYSAKYFFPEKFRFIDTVGEVSVLLKEFLFDPIHKKGLARFLVVEPDLTQQFWVAITETRGAWQVSRAEGQNIIATPGVEQALEKVFAAVMATETGSAAG
ncbi:MAG: hypothetical protein HQL23_06360 [Candidatus Omnitrophica bacterium]|nr:hypothetical protein [Candidatus Omnitrophota bacterium]